MRCRLTAAALVLMVIGLVYRPVSAHAELRSAVPPPGATLPSAPETIVLTFTEPLLTGSITLFDTSFQTIEPPRTTLDADSMVVTAVVPPLPTGRFTVQWRAVATDEHVISGSYAFAIDPLATAGDDSFSGRWIAAAAFVIVLAVSGVLLIRRRRGVGQARI